MHSYFGTKKSKTPSDISFSIASNETFISTRKTKLIAWVNILFQLFFPLSLSFTPVIAATTAVNHVVTQPYILGAGESVDTVAKKYGISVDELKRINIYRTFSKPFMSLTSGDEIEVPRKTSPFSVDNEKNLKNPLENRLASHAQTGAEILASSNAAKSGEQMVRSAVNNGFNSSVQQWLNQFGTARIQVNVNEDFNLDGSAADVLLPFYDNQKSVLFTQLGARNKDSRNTVNIGAGVRTFQGNWMLGANTFFDNDMTGKNRRMGLGAEAWTDYLKLSANSYFGITDWHQSRDFANYNERPANGYDIRAEGWLPSYPQLGGKLMYEKYRGDEVALFGKDERQKNPMAVTAGVNYTPIPLLTVGAEHRAGNGSKNDSSINFQLNYRLGASWQSHISPSAVAASRTLAGSRYDLVERNNNIVLDYQQQQLIRLTLPDSIVGDASSSVTVNAQVTTQYPLERVEWDSAALIAAGGSITQTGLNTIQITLPVYQTNLNNTYPLDAVAYDSNGNASNKATTYIKVNAQTPSALHSQTRVVPEILVADGISTSQVTIHLKDDSRLPIIAMGELLTLEMDVVETETLAKVTSKSAVQISSITESEPGEYLATFTAGIKPGNVIIQPMLGTQLLDPVAVKLIAGELSETLSGFTVTPNTIVADNNTTSTLTFTVKDINGNAIVGLEGVDFNISGVTATSMSPVTETNGVYTATLKGKTAGVATVVPSINGSLISGMSQTVTLTAGALDLDSSILIAMPDTIVADNIATSLVTFTAQDINGNGITGLDVSFDVTGVSGTSLGPVTESNGVYTIPLKGITAGTATVQLKIDGNPVSGMSQTVTLIAGALDTIRSSMTAAPSTIVADNNATSVLTFTAQDANGNTITGLNIGFDISGVTGTMVSPITENNGVYTATLRGITAGTATVVPIVGGSPVGAMSQSVTLTAGSLDTIRSSLIAAPNTIVANNIATSALTFTARDINDNAITGLDLDFSITGITGTSVSSITENNGVYTATLKGITTGTATVAPMVGGVPISGMNQTVTLTAGVFDTVRSVLTATPSTIMADNTEMSTLTLTARDANDNAITDLAVTFEITGIAGTTVSPVIENNGIYVATLKGMTAGTATVVLKIDGSPVSGMTQSVTLKAGVLAATHSMLNVSPATIAANNIATSTLTFTARDVNNNMITGLNVTFDYGGIAGISVSATTDNNDGTYSAILKGTTAGIVTVTSKVAGAIVTGLSNSKTVTLTAGAVASANSGLIVTPASIVANNSATSTLTFTAKDANNNPISGLNVTFDHSGLTGVSISAITDNKDGTYSATLRGSSVGTVTVAAKVAGVVVSGASSTKTIALTAGALADARSSLAVAPASIVANNSATSTLTFTAKDANDHPISGLDVAFSHSGVSGITLSATVDNKDGTYSATLKGTTVGTVTVIAKVGGATVTGSASSKVVALTSAAAITGVIANGQAFTADAGFPKTAFTNAKFQVQINGGVTSNNNYTWTTSSSAVSLSDTGIVTFLASAPSSNNITITATPKTGGAAMTYIFRITDWFYAINSFTQSWQIALDNCYSKSLDLPILSKLTSGQGIRGVGSLWGEWGDTRAIAPFYSTLWAANGASSSTKYGIDTSDGLSWSRGGTSTYQGWACWKAI
ncbi:TPA: inverse autotransporter beta domain-containing protein [Yersinia enterocolitica]|nr:inverse autotransporter beta domain-containing protein [Yersinia enterocolitica]